VVPRGPARFSTLRKSGVDVQFLSLEPQSTIIALPHQHSSRLTDIDFGSFLGTNGTLIDLASGSSHVMPYIDTIGWEILPKQAKGTR
jgi:hypothetical protein